MLSRATDGQIYVLLELVILIIDLEILQKYASLQLEWILRDNGKHFFVIVIDYWVKSISICLKLEFFELKLEYKEMTLNKSLFGHESNCFVACLIVSAHMHWDYSFAVVN